MRLRPGLVLRQVVELVTLRRAHTQGCRLRCRRFPNGPDSVQGAETLGFQEYSAPDPRRRKRTGEEAVWLRLRPNSGPAEPNREGSDFAAEGCLDAAF